MKRFIVLTTIMLTAGLAHAQTTLQHVRLSVEGTSTLHDWTVHSEDVSVVVYPNATTPELKLDSVLVRLPATSLVSGKGAMDDLMHEALRAERHATISFTARDLTLAPTCASGVQHAGVLTLAGRRGAQTVVYDVQRQGSVLRVNGRASVRMTRFGMEPPTAVFGTIRTGDDVTVRFEVDVPMTQ